MLSLFVFGLISVLWLAVGIGMAIIPARVNHWIRRTMSDALQGFLLAQGMMLVNLVLLAGASTLRAYWLWLALGALGLVKALALVGMPPPARARLVSLWERTPAWVHRTAGVVRVGLATLLAIDTLQSSS